MKFLYLHLNHGLKTMRFSAGFETKRYLDHVALGFLRVVFKARRKFYENNFANGNQKVNPLFRVNLGYKRGKSTRYREILGVKNDPKGYSDRLWRIYHEKNTKKESNVDVVIKHLNIVCIKGRDGGSYTSPVETKLFPRWFLFIYSMTTCLVLSSSANYFIESKFYSGIKDSF